MPGWGKDGVLSNAETDLMVKYIQNDPPVPPQWSLADMKKSWKVLVPAREAPHCAAAQARLAELLRRDSARLWSDSDY